jgi:anti-anti-sigma factor
VSFNASLTTTPGTATIEIAGELDASTAPLFHETIDAAAASGATKLVILAAELTYMSSAGLRSLVFARQKMGDDVRIELSGAAELVARTVRMAGLDHSIEMTDA